MPEQPPGLLGTAKRLLQLGASTYGIDPSRLPSPGRAVQGLLPPDPYQAAGAGLNAAARGDYPAALGEFYGGLPQTGVTVAPGSFINYHGSPLTDLQRVLAAPSGRQFDNATSRFGAFFAPTKEGAQRYAGPTGKVYQSNVALSNPYDMPSHEWAALQAPDRGPNGERLPGDQWAARMEQLKQQATQMQADLIARGHDGILLRGPKGDVKEVVHFGDVPVSPVD